MRRAFLFLLVSLSFVAMRAQSPQGAPAPLSRAWPVKVSDGSHVMPTGDDPARAIHVVQDSDAAASQGTAADLAGAWPVKVTDGVNTQPTGDSSARSIHVTTDNAAGQGTAAALSGAWPVKLTDGATTLPLFLNAYIANAVGTVVSVKVSTGILYGLSLQNNNAALVWVEFFNAFSPTLGTTAPVAAFPIPASSSLTIPPGMLGLLSNSNAITMAAVTTYNGTITGSVSGTVFYK
jgi:hypothetical protein